MKPNAIELFLILGLAVGGSTNGTCQDPPSFGGGPVGLPSEGRFPAAAWADINGDGWVDLFVVGSIASGRESRWSAFFINQRDGTFVWWPWLPEDPAGWSGCSWGDYDNDGDVDLFLARNNGGPGRLFRNLGDGTLRMVTMLVDFGEGWIEERPWGIWGAAVGAAWGDFDGDGYLDLFLANPGGPGTLWRNSRDGFLVPVSDSEVGQITGSQGCAWGDYDNDGDPDLFVAVADHRNNALFRNDRGTLVRITSGEVVNNGGYSMSGTWGDYNGDGNLDLYVANRFGPNFLYRNNGDGSFTRVTSGPQVEDEADSSGCLGGLRQ